jgi:hypothetical protein
MCTSDQTYLWRSELLSRGGPKNAYMSPRVTSFVARRTALGVPARGSRHYYSLDLEFAAMARNGKLRVTAGLRSTLTGESARPGEDSTGASAEREGGFDPQSKA